MRRLNCGARSRLLSSFALLLVVGCLFGFGSRPAYAAAVIGSGTATTSPNENGSNIIWSDEVTTAVSGKVVGNLWNTIADDNPSVDEKLDNPLVDANSAAQTTKDAYHVIAELAQTVVKVKSACDIVFWISVVGCLITLVLALLLAISRKELPKGPVVALVVFAAWAVISKFIIPGILENYLTNYAANLQVQLYQNMGNWLR